MAKDTFKILKHRWIFKECLSIFWYYVVKGWDFLNFSLYVEAALPKSSYKKAFWKYAANLQENTHAEVQSNFIEITLWHWCSPINLLHISRTPVPKNTSGGLLFFTPTLWYFKHVLVTE